MKKAINLLFLVCAAILFNHCTSTIDTDANKSILPIVTEEKEVTDITEILNPHVDLENVKSDEVLAIVPNTLSMVSNLDSDSISSRTQSHLTNQDLDYSPLLKYTVSGKLLPVFQKGTFEQKYPLKVVKITRLLNLKYYAVFASPIQYQGETCTLVEISPPSQMRCIDKLNYPVSHVDNAHFLPQKEDQLRNFVFADAQGNIYYASQTTNSAGQKASYRLFQRNPANELRLVSETEFSDRLIKNHQDKFYSMCESGGHFCEISPNRTRIYDYERSQLSRAITSIHPISEDYVITRGDPVFYRLDFKLFELGHEVYNDQSNANNTPISIHPNIDNNNREQGEILYGSYEYFRVNGTIFSLSHVDKVVNGVATGNVQSYFTRFGQRFMHAMIEPNTKHRWTASDLLANQKIVVSMELSSATSFEGLKYKTYIIDLNTLNSTPISSLDQMNITSMRSINEKEILMIGRYDAPSESTKLFKFNVETGDMTILRVGNMLDGTSLYIKQ